MHACMVATGDELVDAQSTTATVFPQCIRADERFYEGQPTAGKSIFTTYAYDAFGNVTRFFDAGDTGTEDYDSVVETHVTSVTDSFGYRSGTTYNFTYGTQTSTTDLNNNRTTCTYDVTIALHWRLARLCRPHLGMVPSLQVGAAFKSADYLVSISAYARLPKRQTAPSSSTLHRMIACCWRCCELVLAYS